MKKEQQRERSSIYNNYIKRTIDVLLSGMALLILWPLLLIIAVIIKITDPGPVLFTQKRVGSKKNGELTYFSIYKYRTMKTSTPKDVPTHLMENPEKWITGIGRILRKFSLDELPQIWNIFIGDMSLVGPRPALYNQYDLKEMRNKEGINILVPGLTGWAQINGRDEISLEEKVKLDKEYLEKQSFCFDIKILFLTFFKVIKKEGVKEGVN